MRFVGRQRSFEWLDEEFGHVTAGQGRFLALRGRRQVGKSRLVTEWLQRQDRPFLYYQALNKPVEQELESFATAIARSNLGALASLVGTGVRWAGWEQALDTLALAGSNGPIGQGPVVVVIDELPYLIDNDPSFEATLQAAWDHKLQHTGILLIVIGSDIHMMEALGSYGRPLYQRIDKQRQIHPLSVADVAQLLDAGPVDAFDTYLMTGGFPKVVACRAEHTSTAAFLDAAMQDDAHPLVYTGQQILSAEFPPGRNARRVLEAIGAGQRAWSALASRTGIDGRNLSLSIDLLVGKGVVSAEDPRACKRFKKRTRYRVNDPYLRFWLRFLADRVPDISRGRGDLVHDDIRSSWQDYAGTAIEPLVQEAVAQLLPDERLASANYVGAFWTRDNQVQVDLVGTEDDTTSRRIEFAGSVKWRARKRFSRSDVDELRDLAQQVPGWESATRLIGVSRTGFNSQLDLDVALTPHDLLDGWRS